MGLSRRNFLHLLGASAAASAFPPSIARALLIPADRRTGTLADVDHIVILMQENRSFDHYFGSLRGVRGFGDPRAARLADGSPVWRQRVGERDVLPFHPEAPSLGLRFLEDLPHDWNTTHAAWRDGHYDQWVAQKGATTMAHLVRSDIPFHYALADAFTICDAYHCSLLGPTDPNRYHMFTGWVGNDGQGGGPVVGNEEAGYAWGTFPERLERAGVSWKVYQDLGEGLDEAHHWGDGDDAYIGNYGDNALLYFRPYQEAEAGDALYRKARGGTQANGGGTLFDSLRRDIRAGRLPQVAWIVAPEAYCEHPNWPANYGAWYIAQVLDALTADPEVWSRTALFVTYDENDGFFDHMVPPTPPLSPEHGHSDVDAGLEIFAGAGDHVRGPYGLGVRVPMLVISPWSTGGWVNSEVFDHTSLIRFIEQRHGPGHPGLEETNITAWRRAACGDLTSAFDFRLPNPAAVALPSTIAYAPPGRKRHPDYKPKPPKQPRMPEQEPGTRPARALPYELHAEAASDPAGGALRLRFANTGQAAAVFQVRFGDGGTMPRCHTVSPNAEWTERWIPMAGAGTAYDVCVHGPNGFFREFQGSLAAGGGEPECSLEYGPAGNWVGLRLRNPGPGAMAIQVREAYTGTVTTAEVAAGASWQHPWALDASYGWYDLTVSSKGRDGFRRRWGGHLETGTASRSDPAMAGG